MSGAEKNVGGGGKMCASREINGFINNRLAFVRFVSRAMLAGIKFLLCRRWKPCRKTRVEGVRNEGRGVYKVSFERGLDGRLPLVDIFFEPPSLLLSPPSKRKKRRNYGRLADPRTTGCHLDI